MKVYKIAMICCSIRQNTVEQTVCCVVYPIRPVLALGESMGELLSADNGAVMMVTFPWICACAAHQAGGGTHA